MTRSWWWIRHAPSSGPDGVIHGRDDCDADLTDRAALSALASRLPLGARFVTSSITRTIQTCDALRRFDANIATPCTEPDFDEQDFGSWTGRCWADLGGEAEAFWRDPVENAPPGGESYRAHARRTWRGIDAIHASTTNETIVCIAHAGTIRAAIALALGGDLHASLRFEIAPLSLTRLDSVESDDKPTWRVCGVNLPAR